MPQNCLNERRYKKMGKIITLQVPPDGCYDCGQFRDEDINTQKKKLIFDCVAWDAKRLSHWYCENCVGEIPFIHFILDIDE